MSATNLDAIDLFAGCGGLSLGLHNAGWNVLTAVERSPMAAQTYFANFMASAANSETEYSAHIAKAAREQISSGLLVGDIQMFLDELTVVQESLAGRELTLLAGGPPCQGFSLAGRRSADDPRNNLVWKFLEVAERLTPLVVLIENVPAIQSSFERGKRAGVLTDLEEALRRTGTMFKGYAVARLLLRADHYGVPQRRKRVFIVGVRGDIAGELGVADGDIWDSERDSWEAGPAELAPRPIDLAPTTAGEALWDLVGATYLPLNLAPTPRAMQYARWARQGQRQTSSPPNHTFRSHSAATQTRFHLLRLFRKHGVPSEVFALAANGESGIEPQLKPLEGLLPIRFALREVTTLRQLAYLVRSLASLKHSQRALDKDAPSPTITTLPDDLGHYAENRTLTIREMARLQSFPDSFTFKGKETTGGEKRRTEVPQYSQVGNAVPPLLSEAIGARLKQLLTSEVLELRPTLGTDKISPDSPRTEAREYDKPSPRNRADQEGKMLGRLEEPDPVRAPAGTGHTEDRLAAGDRIHAR